MIFSVKKVFLSVCLFPALLVAGSIGPCTEYGLSLFEHSLSYAQDQALEGEDNLCQEEKIVYDQLGPLYKKIYIFALTDEMRRRVVIYVCRGLTPFEAINVILRAEQRKFESTGRKRSLSPRDRAMMKDRSCTKEMTG